MIMRSLIKSKDGTSAVEFGLTAPVFFMLLISFFEVCRLLWTQVGLQHGTEMAARCASVDRTVCGSPSAIQNYAASQSLGLTIPPSTFSVAASVCGNQVTATYAFTAGLLRIARRHLECKSVFSAVMLVLAANAAPSTRS
jgi:Flp pilus assembly protein TadG